MIYINIIGAIQMAAVYNVSKEEIKKLKEFIKLQIEYRYPHFRYEFSDKFSSGVVCYNFEEQETADAVYAEIRNYIVFLIEKFIK